jgi:hypothetical protein
LLIDRLGKRVMIASSGLSLAALITLSVVSGRDRAAAPRPVLSGSTGRQPEGRQHRARAAGSSKLTPTEFKESIDADESLKN